MNADGSEPETATDAAGEVTDTPSVNSVAVLLDGESLQEWQRRALDYLVSERSVSIDLLVVNEGAGSDGGGGLGRDDFRPWNLYRAVRRRLAPDQPFRERVGIEELPALSDARIHRCKPVDGDGFGNELPAAAVEALESVDLAIRFGFGIVVGEALEAPTHGVVSFHHGDLRRYRGRPAGFWEFVHGEDSAGVTLQRLSETLDGGEILALETVDLSNARSFPEVQLRLFAASDELLVRGVDRIEDPDAEPDTPSDLGDLYTVPGAVGLVRYALRWTVERLQW